MSLIYLRHESHVLLVRGVEVSAVQRDLHLSQEGVAAQASVMPDGYQHGAGEQLRAADGVLTVGEDRIKS